MTMASGEQKAKQEKHIEITVALGELEEEIDRYRLLVERIRPTDAKEPGQTGESQMLSFVTVLENTPSNIRNAIAELTQIRKTLVELLF